jgi:hypothetical protein
MIDDAPIECTLEDTIDISLSPSRGEVKAQIRGDTVVWLTEPEHAGEFMPNDDPATGAKFKPAKDGDLTIAVAAQTTSGAILREAWKIHVHGVEATALNMRAQVLKPGAVKLVPLDAVIESAQAPPK